MNCGNSRIASFSGWSRSAARLVEDARAFALGLLAAGGWRRSTRCRTAGPCASAPRRSRRARPTLASPRSRRTRRALSRRSARSRARASPTRPPRCQIRSRGSQAKSAWPRARRLAHHREGRVLVDLEGLERVGDEEQFHGRGSESRRTPAGPRTVAQLRRREAAGRSAADTPRLLRTFSGPRCRRFSDGGGAPPSRAGRGREHQGIGHELRATGTVGRRRSARSPRSARPARIVEEAEMAAARPNRDRRAHDVTAPSIATTCDSPGQVEVEMAVVELAVDTALAAGLVGRQHVMSPSVWSPETARTVARPAWRP